MSPSLYKKDYDIIRAAHSSLGIYVIHAHSTSFMQIPTINYPAQSLAVSFPPRRNDLPIKKPSELFRYSTGKKENSDSPSGLNGLNLHFIDRASSVRSCNERRVLREDRPHPLERGKFKEE
jgi:hypothetical protein